MQSTLVSIIIPSYNQGKYLAQTLDSLIEQTHRNWECIIVDDGSTDNTAKIALDYCHEDKRFKYIKKINGGVSSSRNEGLNYAKGRFIKFLDSDDWIEKTSIQNSLHYTEKCNLIISDFKIYSQESNFYSLPDCDLSKVSFTYETILLNWQKEFYIPIHAALISNELLKNFKFSEKLELYEDWVMWLFIFRQNPNVYFIDAPLVTYRKWNNSATFNTNKTLMNEFYAYQNIIENFKIDSEHVKIFNDRFISKVSNKIDQLEKRHAHLTNSNSFKLSLFILTKLAPLYHFLLNKRRKRFK